jgi:hypothetical protein
MLGGAVIDEVYQDDQRRLYWWIWLEAQFQESFISKTILE